MYEVRFSQVSQGNIKMEDNGHLKLRKGRVALIVALVAFLILDAVLITEYKARGANAVSYQIMDKVNHVFDSGTNLVSSIWEPELKKDGDFTSALIVGVDTRYAEFTGEGYVNPVNPERHRSNINADVIMQVVYNHKNGDIFMISIPRDMGIDIVKDCLEFHGSIHWTFDKAQSANCPGGGMQTLTEVVEDVTGIPVHYYGMVSFDVFMDVIDTVGETNEEGEKGIWIDIPEPVYEVYPIEAAGWESVYFPAGHQFLTSEEALKFARSRKASSDFARARRQQMVIEAVKNRIKSSDTLMNPKKIYDLIKIFRTKALISDLNLDEIRAGLNIARDIDEADVTNIVLDPELGGHEVYLNKQPHDRNTAAYYMVPTHWRECPDNVFCRVREYIQAIIKYPKVYEEHAKVFVYARSRDSSGQPNLNNSTYQNLKQNKVPAEIVESKYLANIAGDNDIVIFDFTEGTKPETLRVLADVLGAEVVPANQAPYHVRLNQEDISIVVRGM